MAKRRFKRVKTAKLTIPQKSTRIMILILIAMGVILARAFQLSWIQHEDKLAETMRPKQRVIIEPANRGTIRDRYNIPLAINKLSYQVGISYASIKDVPQTKWVKDENGKKVKKYLRREYIRELADLLALELDLDPTRIIDLIYSKAVFYGSIPFVLKDNVSEETYYKLRALSKDHPAIVARKAHKRVYPQGRVGAEIIGTMGAINRDEYESIVSEIKFLKETLAKVESGDDEEIPEEFTSISTIKRRLEYLRERAYSATDYIGKSGIEARFEKRLRGSYGKHAYHANAQGKNLHDLPDARAPKPGERLLLSISTELQEYAEELLIRTEETREKYWQKMHPDDVPVSGVTSPWIRGGAIVAIDPKTGEVLALAGYPRFDPNDFINSGNLESDRKKWDSINRWYESEEYFVRLWDGRMPLEREIFDKDLKESEESVELSWQVYLDLLFPPYYPIQKLFQEKGTLKDAVKVQRLADQLRQKVGVDDLPAILDALYAKVEGHHPLKSERTSDRDLLISLRIEEMWPEVFALQTDLEPYFGSLKDNYDKVLFLDLCRLSVHGDYFSDSLLNAVSKMSLEKYRSLNQSYARLLSVLEEQARPIFQGTLYAEWREANEKEYLKTKRFEEKERKTFNRPYLDYLDKVERQMFANFWQSSRVDILETLLFGKPLQDKKLQPFSETFIAWHRELLAGAHANLEWRDDFITLRENLSEVRPEIAKAFLKSLRQYKELDRPLVGKYFSLRNEEGRQYEKNLASGFYPKYGYGFARSMAYRQSTVQGSVFKIVTAYEALVQSYTSKGSLSPLKIFDQVRRVKGGWRVGYFDGGAPIPRVYKGGRVPKSLSRNIGETDIVKALERSSNPFFAIASADVLDSPSDLARAAKEFGFGRKSGIDLPGEYKGRVPENLDDDQTGLYAMSIGQGELLVTPLQTAVMLTSFARKGDVVKPKILRLGVEGGDSPDKQVQYGQHFDYDESLQFVGVDFPLFSGVETHPQRNGIEVVSTEIVDKVEIPDPVCEKIYQGLSRVVDVVAPVRLSPMYPQWNSLLDTYSKYRKNIIGKTSSSEIMEVVHMGRKGGVQKTTHGWFSGIVFEEKRTFSSEEPVALEKYGDPELVVAVYQRFGGAGKYSLPLVSAMAEKWREIKAKHAYMENRKEDK